MQVTVDELLLIIGAKEAELFLLRRQLGLLEAEVRGHVAAAEDAHRADTS